MDSIRPDFASSRMPSFRVNERIVAEQADRPMRGAESPTNSRSSGNQAVQRAGRNVNATPMSSRGGRFSDDFLRLSHDPHTRLKQVLLTSAVGVGVTAAVAASVPPTLGLAPVLLSFAGNIGCTAAVHCLPQDHTMLRLASYLGSFAFVGVGVSSFTGLGLPVLKEAALLTGATVSALAIAVSVLPEGFTMRLSPGFVGASVTLAVLSAASLVVGYGTLGLALAQASVWLGLMVSMGLFMSVASRVCERDPDPSSDDVLRASHQVASSIISIFLDYTNLLVMNGRDGRDTNHR